MTLTNASAGKVSPEPGPDWNDVPDKLGLLWPIHVYFFASVFAVLAVVVVVALVLTRSLQEKRFISTIILLAVFVLSLSRSSLLFIDPYLSSESTSLSWNSLWVIINGLGTTCLTASLAILLYLTTVSTRLTEVQPLQHEVNLRRIVFVVTICNFSFFIVSDLVVTFKQDAHVMLTVCQITFAVWGIIVSLGFAALIWRLRMNAQASFDQARYNVHMRHENAKLRRLSLFLAMLSVTGVVFFILKIHEALSGIKTMEYADSWQWFALQTALRFLELTNAVVLLFVFKRKLGSPARFQETPEINNYIDCGTNNPNRRSKMVTENK